MADQDIESRINAAVMAERERCYTLVLEAPYRAKRKDTFKTTCFDVLTRIRDGETPVLPMLDPMHHHSAAAEIGRGKEPGGRNG